MSQEIVSPELALVDPDLAARARAALPGVPAASPRRSVPPAFRPRTEAKPASEARHARPYPLWARLTAALWLLVLGILIGGAAIPHAQDKPRLIPAQDEPPAGACRAPEKPAATPTEPGRGFGFP